MEEVRDFLEETTEEYVESEEYRSGFVQWSVDGNIFIPSGKSVKELPAGYYHIAYDRQTDKYCLKKRKIINEEILHLPESSFEEIISDIQKFWESRKKYEHYKYVYKRGILLYGPPGCGKTSLIGLLSESLITKYKGVVINIKDQDDVEDFDKIIPILRDIEPEKPIILIIEDIDNFVDEDKSVVTNLLNILDGNMQVDKLVTIATTNYPEKLKERVANRPSRFDRKYEIGIPNDKVRKFYLEKKLDKEDLKAINIEEWVKKTEGFTLSHIKEIILSVMILGYTFEDALDEMKRMMEGKGMNPTPIKKKKGIGFDSGEDKK